jgi:hypothetical protein
LVKVAVAVLAEDMVRVQVLADTESHPNQPVKVDPADAVAVRVTVAPERKISEQSAPQSMPGPVTVPVPPPVLAAVRV